MKRLLLFPLVIGSAVGTAQPPSAPNNDAQAVLASHAAKFGVSFYSGLANALHSPARSTGTIALGDPAEVAVEVKRLGDRYEKMLHDSTTTATLAAGDGPYVREFVPPGRTSQVAQFVPSLLFGAVANALQSDVIGSMQSTGEKAARDALASNLKNWKAGAGIPTAKAVQALLKQGKTDEARQAVERATGLISSLQKALGDDSSGKKIAEELLLSALRNSDLSTLKPAATGASSLVDVAKFTSQFLGGTAERLGTHKDTLTLLQGAVADSKNAFAKLIKDANQSGTSLRAVQEVMDDKIPAAAKLLLLEKNLKPGLSAVQRDTLRKVYDAEVKKQKVMNGVASIVDTASTVYSALQVLGVRDPRIGEIVTKANAAQSVLTHAISGNYLGAFLSLTGGFGGGAPDPTQQQLAEITRMLGEISRQLDTVIDLQVKTLEAIQALSLQIAAFERQVNVRFDAVDQRLAEISNNVRLLVWRDIQLACNAAYTNGSNNSGAPETHFQFDVSQYRYANVGHVQRYLRLRSGDALDCAQQLDRLFLTLQGDNAFGDLLSLRAASATLGAVVPAGGGAVRDYRSEVDRFITDAHDPSRVVFTTGWKQEWGHVANGLALLSMPATSATELNTRAKRLASRQADSPLLACAQPTVLRERLQRLLCAQMRGGALETGNAAESRAMRRSSRFLEDPIIRDQLPTLAEWTALLHRPFDFWTGSGSEFNTIEDIARGRGNPYGRDLIVGALGVFDVAIAQQVMLHGDLTARFVYEAAWDPVSNLPKEKDLNQTADATKVNSALAILSNENNPWLRHNVLMLALDASVMAGVNTTGAHVPYATAYAAFQKVKNPAMPSDADKQYLENGALFMRGLFKLPSGAVFSISDTPLLDGTPAIRRVFIQLGAYKFEMPNVTEFRNRALIYPQSLMDALRFRQMLAEKLVDYDLLQDAGLVKNPTRRDQLTKALFVGLN